MENNVRDWYGLKQNKTFRHTPEKKAWIKSEPYFSPYKETTVPIKDILSLPHNVVDVGANTYNPALDTKRNDIIYGTRLPNGQIRVSNGRHRIGALKNSGYDDVEMYIIDRDR